jgi:hypothetical protein
VGLVGTSLQGLDRPSERVGVTRWRQFLAADIASEVNTGLKTSITDSGGEIQYTGSAASSSFTMGTAYRAQYTIINPDTGATVTWSDGEFTGVEVWFKYGTDIPNANKEGFLVGLVNTGTSKALAVGTSYQTGQHRITSSTFTAVAVVNMTWGADDRVFGMVSAPSQAGGTNVLLDLCNAMQMDDSTSPARVQSAVATSLTLVTSANLVLALGFGGDIDVAAYYRLIKTPVAPA